MVGFKLYEDRHFFRNPKAAAAKLTLHASDTPFPVSPYPAARTHVATKSAKGADHGEKGPQAAKTADAGGREQQRTEGEIGP